MSNKPIIIGVAVVAVVLGALSFVFGYDKQSGAAPSVAKDSQPAAAEVAAKVVPFTQLIQGTKSDVSVRANYIITSPTELNDLWKLINANGKPPVVDFKTQAVIAVFAGDQPSSKIAVAKIEDSSARLVSVTITAPDSTCSQKGSTSSPFEIISVPVTSLTLKHKDIPAVESCKN